MNQPQNFDNTDLDRLHAAVKRENPDVVAGHEPTPLWVIVGMMVMTILGGGYAGAYVGGFDSERTNPFAEKPNDPRGVNVVSGPQLDPFQLAMKKGATVFNNCQGCHQPTGLGQPGAIPPLAGSEWVMGGTERITRIALHGLAGPVTVKGNSYNNVMIAPVMSDEEIANVLTYVRNSWGNQAPMVTKQMVAKVRAEVKDHVGPWNPADLEKYKEMNCPGEIPAGPGATAVPAIAPDAAAKK
jgi:mono/diheme cytochrome c family protein